SEQLRRPAVVARDVVRRVPGRRGHRQCERHAARRRERRRLGGGAPVTEAAPDTRLFELELLGGSWERRYRSARPEVEAMPWETLDPRDYSEEVLAAARSAWTGAAFQEHRTAAACASTLRALVEACAPLDLIAAFSRFPLDEIVHVELCAR